MYASMYARHQVISYNDSLVFVHTEREQAHARQDRAQCDVGKSMTDLGRTIASLRCTAIVREA